MTQTCQHPVSQSETTIAPEVPIWVFLKAFKGSTFGTDYKSTSDEVLVLFSILLFLLTVENRRIEKFNSSLVNFTIISSWSG